MRVKSVSGRGFMGLRDESVELPDTGVVCVVGPNGSGKSSLLEAVAEAVWGRTLRGDSGWLEGAAGLVELGLPDGYVRVTRTRGGKRRVEASIGEYDTSAKALEALEAAYGSFDVWRRTHVFSSADAAHFSLATDAERKALLEALLGAEVFDRAEEACAAEAAVVGERERQAAVALARAEAAYRQAYSAFTTLRDREPTPEPRGPDGDAEDVRRRARVAERRVEDAADAVRVALARPVDGAGVPEAAGALAVARAARDAAHHRAEKLCAGVCYTCGQAVPAADVAALPEVLAAAEQEVRAAEEALRGAREDADRLRREFQARAEQARAVERRAREERDGLTYQLGLHAAHQATLSVWRSEQQARAGEVEAAARSASALEEELSAAEVAAGDARAEMAVLGACRAALGLRGARVYLLSDALRGVQDVVNYWLERFYEGGAARCLLELTADSRERGQRAGTVSMVLEGLGSGRYRSLSGGQRRRLDVALLFALAEVAALASGTAPGTLWVDEAFDALDAGGVEAVAEAVREVAADRCVVVVTHSPALVEALRPALTVTR